MLAFAGFGIVLEVLDSLISYPIDPADYRIPKWRFSSERNSSSKALFSSEFSKARRYLGAMNSRIFLTELSKFSESVFSLALRL
jgi:hypothetical protein